MEKKKIHLILQFSLIVVFAIVALGSAEGNYPSYSGSSSSSPSYTPPPLEKTDFPSTVQTCPRCHGTGQDPVYHSVKCLECNGTGKIDASKH